VAVGLAVALGLGVLEGANVGAKVGLMAVKVGRGDWPAAPGVALDAAKGKVSAGAIVRVGANVAGLEVAPLGGDGVATWPTGRLQARVGPSNSKPSRIILL